MQWRGFLIGCAMVDIVLALCASDAMGPMIGMLVGLIIALFGVALLGALSKATGMDQVPDSMEGALHVLALAYALIVLVPLLIGLAKALRRNGNGARASLFVALLLASIPLGGWLSLNALTSY